MSDWKWLYRTEARSIGAYVLSHRKLKHMLGASAIVRELVETRLPEVLGSAGAVLAQAAGGATVGFRTDAELTAFLGQWPAAVAEFAPGLAIVQGWVPGEGPKPMSRLIDQMTKARRRPAVLGPMTSPVVDVSWRGLPVVWEEAPGVDLATQAADGAGAAGSRRKHDAKLLADPGLGGCEMPWHLPDLAGEAHDIAVIHADGNGIGAKVARLQDLGKLAAFSAGLASVGERALGSALHTLKPTQGKWLLGVDVVSGGDDLSMIVRADRALDFLRAYTAAFEQATKAEKDVGALTLCAGVAFVRANHAFHLAHELADGLCKAAKEQGREQSVVRFQRFTSLATEGIAKAPRQGPALAWSGYRLAGRDGEGHVSRLQQAVEAVRALPRGPVRGMVETMAEEVAAGAIDGRAQKQWDRILEVQRALQGKKLPALLKRLDDLAPGLARGPWLGAAGAERSPWGDLLALVAVGEGSDG